MKKLLTRAFVLMLSVTVIVTSTVIPSFADERVPSGDTGTMQSTAGTNKIKGENSFSKMVTSLMDDQSQEQAARERFVTDIAMEGNKATVEFLTDREAELVVGIYTDADDDHMELLASGKTEIYPDMDNAEVTIDTDDMPEYYVAAAYMLDPDTHEPISEQHINRLNTQALREVMESTMEDYAEDDVVDLDTDDEDTETNFAVIGEQTQKFETQGSENKVVSADEEAQVYTIENASEDILSLNIGDPFILDQGEDEILVGIVLNIEKNGTTVTITTDPDADLEDVFDVVKIEETAQAKDCTFEESEEAKEQGIEIQSGSHGQLKKVDVDVEGNFEVKAKGTFVEHKKDDDNYIKLAGSMGFEFSPSVKLILARKYRYFKIDFPIGFTAELKLEAKGTNSLKSMSLGNAGAHIGPLKLSIDVTPQFSAKGSGSIEFEAKMYFGAVIDSQAKKKVAPYVGAKCEGISLSAQLEIFLGFAIAPTASIVHQKVAKTDIKATVGFVLTASNTAKLTYDSDVSHMCGNGMCLDGSIDFRAALSFEAELLSWLEYTRELKSFTVHLKDFYYSIKYNRFGFGTCPYKLNKVTAEVFDEDENAVKDAVIIARHASSGEGAITYKISGSQVDEYLPKTNKNGKVTFYIKSGKFKLTASKDGYSSEAKRVNLYEAGKDITFTLEKDQSGGTTPDPDDPDPDIPITDGDMSGTCGMWIEEEDVPETDDGTGDDHLKWSLSEDGTLTISGNGQMRPYGPSMSYNGLELEEAPWKGRIKKIVFKGSVYGISSHAFEENSGLTEVTLPDTLTEKIYYSYDTDKWTSSSSGDWDISSTIDAIESNAFSGCTNLKTVTIPENANMRWINDGTFADCTSLTNVQLPDKLEYIAENAFYYCESLEQIFLPAGLKEIGPNAFELSGLKSITLPNSLKVIWGYAFGACSLSNITIPASVKRIGGGAFSENPDLKSVYFMGNAPELSDGEQVPLIGDFDSEDPWMTYEQDGTPFAENEHEITAYIPAGDSTWTDDVKAMYEGNDPNGEEEPYDPEQDPDYDPDDPDYGGKTFTIVWKTWVPGKSTSSVSPSGIKTMSTYMGGYETNEECISTSDFDELVPGEEYVIAAVKDSEANNLLASDNLVYIWQGEADSEGMISFSYVLPDSITGEDGEEIEPEILLFGAGGTSIDDLEVSLKESEKGYNGERYYPAVLLNDNDYDLEEGVDYELTGDVSAVEPGDYAVKVTLKGDYYGSKTLNYKITKSTAFMYCWDEDLVLGQNTFCFIDTNSDEPLTYTSSDPNVAVVEEDGYIVTKAVGTCSISVEAKENDHYTAASGNIRVKVVPKGVKLTSAKNVKGRKIKATWKKGSGITGYDVQYGLKKSFKGAKIKTIKKAKTTKLTIKKLKKKKTYYVRIRTYKKMGSKKYTSDWSNVKKVKIKK